MPKVATYNCPARYGNAADDVQKLADRGNTVIAVQEVADADVAKLTPKGWRRHRPAKARSAAIFWDPKVWTVLGRGAYRIHSKGWGTPRYIVWVNLQHRATGKTRRFGSVHLVAFKTSKPAHGHEYRKQADRVATWLDRGPRRVALGDYNGTPGSGWLKPVDKVARPHTPKTKSGPGGQWIDLIYTANQIPNAKGAKTVKLRGDHKAVEADLPL